MKKKQNATKTIKPTPEKKMGIGSPVFCTFSFTPNPITSAQVRQHSRENGSLFNFSESSRGRGAQLLLISFGTTRLHGICIGSINRMEDRGHTLQPHSLGTGDKCPYPPQISEFFVWDWEGAQKSFILLDQTTGDLTFTSPGHTHSLYLCPHGLLFFQQSCYVGNLLSYK